ncbi:MAG: 4Fe-4S binding protein, partial [Muribaculaceae bacterium]|nr:4Fe-4S binding protein [Muribaculaceae bacterium]
MLRKIRIILALVSIVLVTLLFVDFTGTSARYFGWLAKIQFLPAVFSANVVVLIALAVLTLLLGRVYCSVICPLGIMQDIFGRFGRMGRKHRYRYSYSPSLTILRIAVFAAWVLAIIIGVSVITTLLAPYSAYGRIAQTLLQPIWIFGNNLLADAAERADNYAFYRVDIWLRSPLTLTVAVLTLIVLGVLAWRNGRTYCNTICPVGTILGYLSQFSLFKPVIDKSKCVNCGLCARKCKASCIDSKNHSIDYTRCVACMDCIDTCTHGAISYTRRRLVQKPATADAPDYGRRIFLGAGLALGSAAIAKAQEKVTDGGLAPILDKKRPERRTPIAPPGSKSLRHLSDHCTACQLCVAECPNGVLRPSTDIDRFMQPESSFERGYCRPECTRCSDVCPAGAILPLTVEDKTAVR